MPKSMAEPIGTTTPTHRDAGVLDARARGGVRRVVYAASSAAYGESPRCPRSRRMPPAPISPYGGLKLAGEHTAGLRARVYGLETVCLRYFNVFGPRQDPKSEYAAVIPKFITAALAGRQPRIFGDGTQSRDFCHIDNIIEANFKAASGDARAGLGARVQHRLRRGDRLNQVVALIGDILGRRIDADPRRRSGQATSSTRGPTSRRAREPASATPRRCRSPKVCAARSSGISSRRPVAECLSSA